MCDEILYPAMDTAAMKRQKHKHGWHLFRHTAATGARAKSHNLKLLQDTLHPSDDRAIHS